MGRWSAPSDPVAEIERELATIAHEVRRTASVAPILAYIRGNPLTMEVVRYHGIRDEDIEQWHQDLVRTGGAQWVGGSYAPVIALALPNGLDFIATSLKSRPPDWDDYNVWLKISYDVLASLDNRRPLAGELFREVHDDA